jgi:hypothetical protein
MMLARGRYTVVMANFTRRVTDLLHSPKTQEMITKVKDQANRPERKAKIHQVADKFKHRGAAGSHGAGPSDRPGPGPGAGPGPGTGGGI